jgi:hypothetical protein
VDTFDDSDWHVGDFDTLADAIEAAEKRASPLQAMYVYDDEGARLHDAGGDR